MPTDETMPGQTPTVVDSFGAARAAICPPEPSGELTAWLLQIAPSNNSSTVRLPAFEVPQIRPATDVQPLDLVAREPGYQRPRAGRRVWAVEAAFSRDIEGLSSLEIANRQDLRDYSEHDARGRSRSEGRRVSEGRRILERLGAWPWAVGLPLPRRWWTQAAYVDALAGWHHDAWIEAWEDLHWRAQRLTGGDHWGNATDVRRARNAYVTALSAVRYLREAA
jgi:hypothetical protein